MKRRKMIGRALAIGVLLPGLPILSQSWQGPPKTPGSRPKSTLAARSGRPSIGVSATNSFGSAGIRRVLTVANPIRVTVLPAAAALAPSQSQTFAASLVNASDTSVTWSVSPALGQISQSGVYTAPPNLADQVVVTVKATSSQDTSKFSTASIVLLPSGGSPATLRGAAASRILIGTAASGSEVTPDPLQDPQYAGTLATQYDLLVPENALKWAVIHPSPQTYRFGPGDELVSFAQAHGMAVRGHNLCWFSANPEWLTTLAKTATPATMSKVLQDHIATVVGHFKGKVFAWDVVNEAVSDNATGVGTDLQDSIWYNQPGIGLSGTGYIEQAFRWAHEADPNALLFYNEYGIEGAGPKFQAVYNMLKDFVARGVPINGVGMQMHLDTSGYPSSEDLAANIQKLGALGLQVHITEMDVRLPVSANGSASAAALQQQEAVYRQVLQVCLMSPNCTAFQTWEFSDRYSWIPYYFRGYGAALPFDGGYEAKPAFNGMLRALNAQLPILAVNAVSNKGNTITGPLVPGELVEIRLPRRESVRGNTSLFHGQVFFDELAATIVYATWNQVEVVVPYGVEGRQTVSVWYSEAGARSNAVTLPVAQ